MVRMPEIEDGIPEMRAAECTEGSQNTPGQGGACETFLTIPLKIT